MICINSLQFLLKIKIDKGRDASYGFKTSN